MGLVRLEDIDEIFENNAEKLSSYVTSLVGSEESIDIVQLAFQKLINQITKKKN